MARIREREGARASSGSVLDPDEWQLYTEDAIYDGYMPISDRISEIFSVAGAALLSVGGAGAVLVALSSWFGKVWASRILEREKAELSKSIEVTKADLTRSIEGEKATMAAFHEEHQAEIQELSSQRLDALNRRRDVYARLATKMRVLLRADMSSEQREKDKWAFLAAYDEGYIWASESVAVAVRDLLETMERKAAADNNARVMPPNAPGYPQVNAAAQALDREAQERYRRCLLRCEGIAAFPNPMSSIESSHSNMRYAAMMEPAPSARDQVDEKRPTGRSAARQFLPILANIKYLQPAADVSVREAEHDPRGALWRRLAGCSIDTFGWDQL